MTPEDTLKLTPKVRNQVLIGLGAAAEVSDTYQISASWKLNSITEFIFNAYYGGYYLNKRISKTDHALQTPAFEQVRRSRIPLLPRAVLMLEQSVNNSKLASQYLTDKAKEQSELVYEGIHEKTINILLNTEGMDVALNARGWGVQDLQEFINSGEDEGVSQIYRSMYERTLNLFGNPALIRNAANILSSLVVDKKPEAEIERFVASTVIALPIETANEE